MFPTSWCICGASSLLHPATTGGRRASWLTRVGDIFFGLKLPESLPASLHNHHHVSTSRCRRRRRLFLPFQNAGWEDREIRTATTPRNIKFPTSPTQRQLRVGIKARSIRWVRIISLCRGQSLCQTYTEHTTEASSLQSLRNTFHQALYSLQVSVLLLKRALHTGISPRPMVDWAPDSVIPNFVGLADAQTTLFTQPIP